MKESVGILIISRKTNRFLLLHRVNKPLVWSLLSGKMDVKGETPLQTIKREIKEEINLDPSRIKNIKKIGELKDNNLFHLFVGFVDDEFKPQLQVSELDGYGWHTLKDLPSPLHNKWHSTFHLVKKYLSLREDIIKIIKNLLDD